MSQQDLNAFADWLVANQSKKGTPEYDTVASAFQELDAQLNPPNTSLWVVWRQRAAHRPVSLISTDGSRCSNRAKDTRLLIGQEPGFSFEDDILNMNPRFVGREQAAEMGYDEAIPGLGGEGFEPASRFIAEKKDALNYTPAIPWNQVKADPSAANILGFMGETAITSLPDMAAALISAPAYFASYISPIAEERAKNDGGRQVTPEDLAYAAVAAVTIAKAERVGAKGIFGDMTGNVVTRPLKAGAKEATTEAIQNPVEYGAGTINTAAGFDPAVAADQALAGIVGGSGSGAGLRATADTVKGATKDLATITR